MNPSSEACARARMPEQAALHDREHTPSSYGGRRPGECVFCHPSVWSKLDARVAVAGDADRQMAMLIEEGMPPRIAQEATGATLIWEDRATGAEKAAAYSRTQALDAARSLITARNVLFSKLHAMASDMAAFGATRDEMSSALTSVLAGAQANSPSIPWSLGIDVVGIAETHAQLDAVTNRPASGHFIEH